MQKVLSIPAVFKHLGKAQGPTRSAKEVSIARARTYTKTTKLVQESDDKAMKVVSLLLMSLNAVLLFWYFVDVNTAISTGYEMKTMQNRISSLTEEQKKLNLKIAEQSSIIAFQNDSVNSLYVPVTAASYVTLGTSGDHLTMRK